MSRTEFKSPMAVVCAAVACLLAPMPSAACIGDECLQIWSTEADGGALTIEFDFSARIPTFRSFCTGNDAQCLYTALDPGFINTPEAAPGSGFHPVADGTRVTLEIVSIAPGASVVIDGSRLDAPGKRTSLGTLPEIHSHPSWQLLLPGDTFGDYPVAFRLTTESPLYAASETFLVTLTNVQPTPPPATPSATPTATATPAAESACAGDCDASDDVTVDEILTCVNAALGTSAGCSACDGDSDGAVTVNEIIAAVNAALTGCATEPAVTLAELQSSIFTPRCSTPLCHNSGTDAGGLDLTDGVSHRDLVGVVPRAVIAARAGQMLVDPGKPENSFLLIKLLGPPAGAGGRMPLIGGFLTEEQVDAVRNWILAGALP